MSTVTLLRVTIAVAGRWAVGGVDDGVHAADLPVLRDLRHTSDSPRAHIPATSLAGSLRAHLDPTAAERWLGPEPGSKELATGSLDRSRQGLLRLLGVTLDDSMSVHQRKATAVDGQRRAASGGTFRTEEWVSGGRLTMFMEHPGPYDASLGAMLATWRPVVGRSRTSGMGIAQVVDFDALTLDLTRKADLHWWIGQRREWLDPAGALPLVGTQPNLDGVLGVPRKPADGWSMSIEWTVAEPVHIGFDSPASVEGQSSKVALIFRVGGRPAVPGSSWKGIYRHGVNHVLLCAGLRDDTDRHEVLAHLFGDTRRRGVVQFADAQVLGTETDSCTRTHAPIDRFTGGAKRGALHTIEAIPRGSTLPQQMFALEAVPAPLTNLLRHVVRDLHDGFRSIGRGSSRGYGWIKAPAGDPSLATQPVVLAEVLAACPTSRSNRPLGEQDES